MSRSTSQTVQTSLNYGPVGLTAKLRVFVADMMRSESAATAMYVQNAEIRSSGRNWLM